MSCRCDEEFLNPYDHGSMEVIEEHDMPDVPAYIRIITGQCTACKRIWEITVEEVGNGRYSSRCIELRENPFAKKA